MTLFRTAAERASGGVHRLLGTGGVFFDSMLIYVIRNHEAYKGRGAQDGHLDFHTAPKLRLIQQSAHATYWAVQ